MASVCSVAGGEEGGVLGTAAAVLDARQYKVEIETGSFGNAVEFKTLWLK